MSRMGAFWLGGLGGLLPVATSIITVDLAPLIDNAGNLTKGNLVGYGIRVLVLILVGGTVAALNIEVRQPLALVQLGIAAPALITSYINGATLPDKTPKTAFFSIISSAHAQERGDEMRGRGTSGFLSDVIAGAGVRLDTLSERANVSAKASDGPAMSGSVRTGTVVVPDTVTGAVDYPATPAGTLSGSGVYCSTALGRFGPGPQQQLGLPCSVPISGKEITGIVTK